MASNRLSIYKGQPITDLLERVNAQARGGEDDRYSISGAINGAVARYQEVCRQHRPKLSPAEWNCLADLLNGTYLLDELWARKPAQLIAMELEDGIRLNRLDEKWGISGPLLLNKISDWDHATGVSCLEAIEAFWAHSEAGTEFWDPLRRITAIAKEAEQLMEPA